VAFVEWFRSEDFGWFSDSFALLLPLLLFPAANLLSSFSLDGFKFSSNCLPISVFDSTIRSSFKHCTLSVQLRNLLPLGWTSRFCSRFSPIQAALGELNEEPGKRAKSTAVVNATNYMALSIAPHYCAKLSF